MKIVFRTNKNIHSYGTMMTAFAYELGTMFLHTVLWWCGIIQYPRGKGKYAEIWAVYEWKKGRMISCPIGVAGLYSNIKGSQKVLWIGWLALLKQYRKKGYGTEMLKEIEGRAQKLRCKTLMVYCEAASKAMDFYLKHGYEP